MKIEERRKRLIICIKKNLPQHFYGLYICYKYKKVLGKKCNLRNPKTYTEKIQWSKINRTDPIISKLSDKIAVRSWVLEKVGAEYLVPTIGGVFSSVNEMNFEVLPDKFVIKANHGSGYNLVVNNKSELDLDKTKKIIEGWLEENFAYNTFEMQYKDISPKLYIEQNLLSGDMNDLPDYKFFCFNGKVFCSYTKTDCVFDHFKGKLGIFDREYNLMPYYREGYTPIRNQLPKPDNYDKMVEIAEKLSKGFSHVRVDLYNIKGKIYFGEMTFSTGAGYCRFVPEEFDLILGNQWDLNQGI